jgi:hypothetical protein
MKKVLAMLALALFLGGISATAIAAPAESYVAIELNEEEKKSEKKAEKKSEATKSSDCSKECSKKCDGEKKDSKK